MPTFKTGNELKQYLVENYSEELSQHCIFIAKSENGKLLIMEVSLLFKTLPTNPLGLIVHGLCFLGVNVVAIECITDKSALLAGYSKT